MPTIVHVSGYNSGFGGGINVDYHLCERGYNVIALSLPGYDDSEISHEYASGGMQSHFLSLSMAIRDICGEEPVHFIGHSMGAIVGAMTAQYDPGCIASLIMLSPSCLKEESMLSLLWRFAMSGRNMRLELAEELKNIEFPGNYRSGGSNWSGMARKLMRIKEVQKLCCDDLREILLYGDLTMPQLIISGGRDTVYPPDMIKRKLEGWEGEIFVGPHLFHNSTMSQAGYVVDVAEAFIDGIK